MKCDTCSNVSFGHCERARDSMSWNSLRKSGFKKRQARRASTSMNTEGARTTRLRTSPFVLVTFTSRASTHPTARALHACAF